jgi:hypothetical protein
VLGDDEIDPEELSRLKALIAKASEGRKTADDTTLRKATKETE